MRTNRHPDAGVIVPPRITAVPSGTAETAPTQRANIFNIGLRRVAQDGRKPRVMPSAKVEAAIGRWKQMIGNGLRSQMDERRALEIDVAVHVLSRMLELGRPSYVYIA